MSLGCISTPIITLRRNARKARRAINVPLQVIIKSINAGMGTTMVIVTHELQSIFNIADRIIMLDKAAKGIIAEGDPRWLKDHATDPR
jgi:phospholipid/cholesterol/gamma-HCH transport system ATP-binding protein